MTTSCKKLEVLVPGASVISTYLIGTDVLPSGLVSGNLVMILSEEQGKLSSILFIES